MSGTDEGRPSGETVPEERGGAAQDRVDGRRIVAWARQNRAKLEILAIGGVALGGIVCMVIATLVIVWRLANP